MTIKKYKMSSKFAYCTGLDNEAYHGRANRIYHRVNGIFRGIGYYCTYCKQIVLDKDIKKMFDDLHDNDSMLNDNEKAIVKIGK